MVTSTITSIESNLKMQAKDGDAIADDQSSQQEKESEVMDGGGEEEESGWANSIAKVLQTSKPKSKKTLVLSRAKNLQRPKNEPTKPNYNFEIDGEIKEEKPDTDLFNENFKKTKENNKKLLLRVKPSLADREREKTFKKIATKGVVQLFNAVRIQQKDIDQQIKEAGPLDHRKDAVLNNINKKKFLNVLMGGARAKSELVDNPIKTEIKKDDDNSSSSDSDADDNERTTKRKSEWNVLRNDFMTNKKLKNWDQDDSDEQQNSNPGSSFSDSE